MTMTRFTNPTLDTIKARNHGRGPIWIPLSFVEFVEVAT